MLTTRLIQKNVVYLTLTPEERGTRELKAIATLSTISPCARMYDFDYPDQLKKKAKSNVEGHLTGAGELVFIELFSSLAVGR